MFGKNYEAEVKRLFGRVMQEWREGTLKISEADFGDRYKISDRFVRMIQAGQHLPSAMQFIRMVMDMDRGSVWKLMVGLGKIKRQANGDDEPTPDLSSGEKA
jgi:hypothetical protein